MPWFLNLDTNEEFWEDEELFPGKLQMRLKKIEKPTEKRTFEPERTERRIQGEVAKRKRNCR